MTQFKLPEIDTGVIVHEALKSSAFAAAGVTFEPTSRSAGEVFFTKVGPVEFHEHNFGAENDKIVDETENSAVSVTLTSLYHSEKFDKYQHTPGTAAMKLIETMEAWLPQAIDRWIASEISSIVWDGFQGTPAEVDGTAASFLAPQFALQDAGYNPSATVLYNQARSLVAKALNENTNRSDLAVNVVDGVQLGSTTGYFQNLRTGVLEDGQKIGFVIDPAFTKAFVAAPTEVTVITGETDSTLAAENAIYAKVEIRLGIGSVAGSVVPLVYAEADEVEEVEEA